MPKAFNEIEKPDDSADAIKLRLEKRFSLEVNTTYDVEFLDSKVKDIDYNDGELYNQRKPVRGNTFFILYYVVYKYKVHLSLVNSLSY